MISNQIYNEEELLSRVSDGNERAFEILFNEWYARLVIFGEKFLITRQEAEDLVTEAFIRFWKARKNFAALNSIKSFLYITTRNSALNLIRQRRLHGFTELTNQDVVTDESYAELESLRAEMVGTLYREIENLPDKCRQVVLLTYREGLSSQQVADRLGISVSNVTSQRSRAVQLLKVALAEKYPLLFIAYLSHLLLSIFSEN